MTLVFNEVAWLVSEANKEVAQTCVRKHGAQGAGDEIGATYIGACTVEYVLTCLKREVAADPSNKLAKRLWDYLQGYLP